MARGTLMLVTGVVMASVTCWRYLRRSNLRRLAISRLAISLAYRRVSHDVRSGVDSSRALGDLSDRKREKGQKSEAKHECPPMDDAALTPHGATLRRRQGCRPCAGA